MSIINYILSLITNKNYDKKETTEIKHEVIEEQKEITAIENKPINQNIKKYKIAGVTFKNEDGKDIQKEIKKYSKNTLQKVLLMKKTCF